MGGGQHSTMVSVHALGHSWPGSIPSGTGVNQQYCLEESGQWLENLDSTHLVLDSGKLVLQKGGSLLLRGLLHIFECIVGDLNSNPWLVEIIRQQRFYPLSQRFWRWG